MLIVTLVRVTIVETGKVVVFVTVLVVVVVWSVEDSEYT